jgi:hypothetical protein
MTSPYCDSVKDDAERMVIPTAPDPEWDGAPPDRWVRLVRSLERDVAPHEWRWYGPYQLLRTARNLYLHSYFVADFGPVSALVAYQAVEAAFRVVYHDRENDTFEKLIKQATADGFLTGDHIAWVNDLREMRNLLAHPAHQIYRRHPFDMMLVYAHEVVVTIMNAPPRPNPPW